MWIEWSVSFGGLWLFLAPRILSFTDATLATVAQMVLGAAVAVLAVWSAIAATNARKIARPADLQIFLGAHHINGVSQMFNSIRAIVVDGNPAGFSAFCSYQDHTATTATSIDGSSGGVLQYINRCYIVGINCAQ